jgi:hypothetical protein
MPSADAGRTEPSGVAVEVRVLSNMATPYMRVHLALAGGVVTAEWWATALGVIPLRRRHLTVPLGQVQSLRTRGALFPARLAAALGLTALLYLVSLAVWAAALVGVGALVLLLLCFVDVLEVRHEGVSRLIPFCFWHRHRVNGWVKAVAAEGGSGSSEE